MASLLTGESSHHQAPGLNFKVPQQKIEGVGGRWYLSRKEIEENSPSRKDGIELKKETYLRKSFCTFLQDLGVKLKVPQVTIATAIVFCHRFFLRQSHAKNDRSIIAIACMFLAGKVEETPRHLKDVILVSYEIIHQNDAAAVQRIKQKEVYEHKKELILLGERVVLGTLGFDLNVQHPYRPLVEAIKKFKVAKNALAQVAWNFINDGLRTSLCLQFLPRQIAAGAIFLAALCLKVKLPSDGDEAWWQDYGVTLRQLDEYSDQMLELYEQHTVPQFQVNEVEGSAQGGQPPSKARADEEYVASYSSSHGGSTSKASSSKPAQSRPDCWGEDGISDLQHHGREAITRQGNSGETQNKTEFGVEGHGDDDQEGNCVRIKPRDAEGLKDKYHGRNLPDKDVTVGQPPQDAKIKLDRGKLKAAFERRKARGEMTHEIDLMDELERELEDVEVPVDSEKSKRKRKQSWSKPSRPEHESSHHMKYSNEARDGQCQAIKGQSLHGDDFDTVEEGEVEQADEVDRVYQSPGSSRKRKSGNPLDWNGLGRLG